MKCNHLSQKDVDLLSLAAICGAKTKTFSKYIFVAFAENAFSFKIESSPMSCWSTFWHIMCYNTFSFLSFFLPVLIQLQNSNEDSSLEWNASLNKKNSGWWWKYKSGLMDDEHISEEWSQMMISATQWPFSKKTLSCSHFAFPNNVIFTFHEFVFFVLFKYESTS